MRMSFILSATLAMSVTLFARSQNVISLSAKKAPLKDVLKRIEEKSNYRFLYSDNTVNNKDITVKISNVFIDEALTKILTGTGLTYTINSNQLITLFSSSEKTVAFQSITGIVKNESGDGLMGVSVGVKGTSKGTTTNNKGEYTIEAGQGDVLVFSFVGFVSQEIKIDQQRNLPILLLRSNESMNDVVVVGYGVQKKVNLSGSVATVSGAKLAESPAPTFTNLLAGRVAGLTIVQPTGEPGMDAGSIQIRGLGSYGAANTPLILVDGIVSTLSNLSPQDIESVSVLKDAASASIYGSRGANGVILITTKKGKNGAARIDYTNNFGTTQATVLPKFITNSVQYMTMYNQALQRGGQAPMYTQAQIDEYKNATDQNKYPNFDWMKYIFKSAPIQSHTLSMSGGTNSSTYYLSAGYQKQKGIMNVYDYDRYNAVFDYSAAVNKVVKVGTNVNFSYQNIIAPNFTNTNIILLAYAQAPTFSPYLPDGSGRRANRDYVSTGGSNRTVDEVYAQGAQYTKNYNVNAQAYVDVNILKGLTWQTKGAVVFYNQDYKSRAFPTEQQSYAFQPVAGQYVATGNGNPPFSGLVQSSERDVTLTVNSTFNYAKNIGKDHHFNALFGYEQINNTSTNLGAQRFNFASNSINEINGGPTTNSTNSGDAFQYALQSLFGRVNYNYKGKYLLEGDIRYDGTSRVSPAHRWGTFGGGSAAWRVSEEDFLKNTAPWISDLKIRASYGVLGNQEIGNYPYQGILQNTAYPFSNTLTTGAILNALTDPNLRWEKTATTDIGLDLSIKNGLFGLIVDWYSKKTSDILAQQSDLPYSVGLSAPIVNAGAMVNKGFEFELSHQNKIGQLTYGVNVIFSANRNKVTQALAPSKGVFEVGRPYNSFYVYQWAGIFQSQDEINKSPAQPNSGVLKPGDLKIADVNGDGQITPDDRISISPFPTFTYSTGFNAGWKGFLLNVFFQGVKGQKFYVRDWGIDPFQQGAAPTQEFLNAWSPTNPSTTVPAVYKDGYAGVNGYNSTFFLKDASYLRLKSVNLSYTFPKSVIRTPIIKTLTVYVSGSNLLTWTPYPGADPERAGSGRYAQFPQLRVFSGGVRITL